MQQNPSYSDNIRVQTLPPLNECLHLLDLAGTGNEWVSATPFFRRSFQVLVDHIQAHAQYISQLEDSLAIHMRPTQSDGSVLSKLATKAETSRVEKLEQQYDALANEQSIWRSKQVECTCRTEEVAGKLDVLQEQLKGTEMKLGLTPNRFSLAPGLEARPSSRHGPSSSPEVATLSIVERVRRLERRADQLSDTVAKAEAESMRATTSLREMELRNEGALERVRGEVRSAVAAASSNAWSEGEAEAANRVKDVEARVMGRVSMLEDVVESRVAGLNTRLTTALTSEIDVRLKDLEERNKLEVQRLQGGLDALARDKLSVASIDQYMTHVSSLVEEVASSLTEEVRSKSGELETVQQQLQQLSASCASKAGLEAFEEQNRFVASELERMRLASDQVRSMTVLVDEARGVSHAASAGIMRLSADLEEMREGMTGIRSTLEVQRVQDSDIASLARQLSSVLKDVRTLKDTVLGSMPMDSNQNASVGGAAETALQLPSTSEAGLAPGSLPLQQRVHALDSQLAQVASLLAGKTRRVEQQISSLSRQMETNSEAMRALNSSTSSLVEEHSSAIQRLTLTLSSGLEDRPRQSIVRQALLEMQQDMREELASSLQQLKESVLAVQADANATKEDVSRMQVAQNTVEGRLVVEATAREALEKKVEAAQAATQNLKPWIEALEGHLKSLKAQVDIHAQLHERESVLVGAVEQSAAAGLASVSAGLSSVRGELNTRVEGVMGVVNSRMEGVEAICKEQRVEIQALRDRASATVSEESVRALVEGGCRQVLQAELARHISREDAKWQAWAEQYSRRLEQCVSRHELDDVAAVLVSSAQRDASEAAQTQLGDVLGNKLSSIKSELNERVDGVREQVGGLLGRLADLAEALTRAARQEDMHVLSREVSRKVDATVLDDALRALARDISRTMTRAELEVELAKKLDVKTYLSATTVQALTNAAGALHRLPAVGQKSPPQQNSRAN